MVILLGLETLSKLEEFWANNNQISDWKEVFFMDFVKFVFLFGGKLKVVCE